MPKLIDRQPDQRFVGLFLGQSGSGKTVAEASFPRPMHFEDFDGRIGGVDGAPWIDKNGITYDYWPPRMTDLIPKLNKKFESWLVGGTLIQLPATHVTDSLTNECYAFLRQAIPLTHNDSKGSERRGKFLGPVLMAGPEDYGLEAQATYDYISFLKTLQIPNIIISAHLVDRYAKSDPENPFSENIVVGQKLSVRDKIGTNIMTHFDHVFLFQKEVVNGRGRYYVYFKDDPSGLARTSLRNLPSGKYEVTDKNFYEEMIRLSKGNS